MQVKASPRIEGLLKRALDCQKRNDFFQAEKLYREILTLDPNHADTLHLLGVMAKSLGRPDIAIEMICQAIKINPAMPAYYNNLGLAFKDRRQFDKAILLFEHVLKLKPGDKDARGNLASALNRSGQSEKALWIYEELTNEGFIDPVICNDYASTFLYLARREEAKAWFEKALSLQPDYANTKANLAYLELQAGNFAQGWKDMEWRWNLSDAVPHGLPGPLWDGGDLTGKTILVHCEQGIGDSLQFIRFLPAVKAQGGTVVLSCHKALQTLFQKLPGVDRIAPDIYEQKPDFSYDCYVPLMTLPLLCGTTVSTIPASTPYLHADPAQKEIWRERLAALKGLKIGIVWRGNPDHINDHNRSITAARFEECLPKDGISVINLQKDAREDELQAFVHQKIFNAAPWLENFSDTAAAITQLDLVLTVDTSVCHLAGALGAPVWTLLPAASDWRWLLDREDTPWYPTMRLFRTPRGGAWRDTLVIVKDALSSFGK